MARLATLTKGIWESFERNLSANGLTAEDVVKLNAHPDIIALMLATMREHPAFSLIHDRFTPLADKVAMVKSWPGITSEEVDAALLTAQENGTIAGYEAEVGKNPFLDIVITVYRESLPATLIYARERMKEAWGDKYSEWEAAYAQGVDDDRVKAIPGAKQFTPNRIVIEVVDLGANWNRKDGIVLEEVQKAQAPKLADFAVIYDAIQSPKWVEQMDGDNVPYALVAALLLNVPGFDSWRCSPSVWRFGDGAKLRGCHVEVRFYDGAMPVLREYKR